MRLNQAIQRALWLTIAAMVLAHPAQAEELDAAARIQALEAKMQLMQQQRVEQDKQIELLNKELNTVKTQLDQPKAQPQTAITAIKSSKAGTPVIAAFKDGITLQDDSGNWQLAINGRVQADYRAFSPDATAADTFSLRRARLGGTLTFYQDYVARVEGEYASGDTSLTYGYIDLNHFKSAKIRIGQFKPFYGLERAMSTNFTDFQERSMADALLGSTYDRGVMVFGAPTKGLNYSLAYINGNGTADENNARQDNKDITLRLTSNIAELMGWQNSVVHIGGFYGTGEQGSRRQANSVPQDRTTARGLSFFQTTCPSTNCGAAVSNGFGENVDRTLSGLETALAYGPVKLQSEYIQAKFDGDHFDRKLKDWYVNAVWNVTGESFADSYQDGVFGRLHPKNNFQPDGTGWGALQLGIRYDQFNADDYKKTAAGNNAAGGILLNNPSGTSDGVLVATNKADAWTLGANWILNPNVRLVANWVRTNFDTPVIVRADGKNSSLDHEDAVTMRAQFDF